MNNCVQTKKYVQYCAICTMFSTQFIFVVMLIGVLVCVVVGKGEGWWGEGGRGGGENWWCFMLCQLVH